MDEKIDAPSRSTCRIALPGGNPAVVRPNG